MEWEAFEEDFGPLTLHKRIDWAAALLMHQQAIFHYGERAPDLTDFLPEWEREGEGEGAHIADWFSAVARKP